MNIFATDPDPVRSAIALDDKRLVKMCVETAQILSTAIRQTHGDALANALGLYKKTHDNHPCVKWVKTNNVALAWLVEHGLALCLEYSLRFNKTHKSLQIVMAISTLLPDQSEYEYDSLSFQNSARNAHLGLDFTYITPHEAYQTYLNARWLSDKKPPRWTNRQPPEWRN